MFKLPMKDTYTMRKVRRNIEETLIIITMRAFSEGVRTEKTAELIDNLIDFCEAIDLYDKGELRNKYLEMNVKEFMYVHCKKEH